jgi:hypothetical protein
MAQINRLFKNIPDMKHLLPFAALVWLYSCSTQQSNDSSDTTDQNAQANYCYSKFSPVLDVYLAELNRNTDSAERCVALYDRMEQTDSAGYAVFHIGHDVVEEEGGKRFATDSWLFIDTTNNACFDYDLAQEKLIPLK